MYSPTPVNKTIASLVIVVSLLLPSFPAPLLTVDALASLPLLQKNDLVYQGAFAVPTAATDETGFGYGGTAIAFNPNKQSLFMVGHDWHQRVAEISIPALKTATKASDLPVATMLQNFADPTDGKMHQVDVDTIKVGGLLVTGNQLIHSAYSYYDGDANQLLSHTVTSLELNKTNDSQGPYKVGNVGAGFVSGYMANIPSAWQAALGSPAMTGQCCIAIVSRTSYGPAVFGFNPTDVGAKNPVPATPFLYYDEKHTTLGAWSGDNTQFNGNTQIRGLVFPENTRSVLFIGSQGMGKFCYGTGAECKDQANDSKGVHGYPYQYQIWAYDANDLVAVKNGQKQPWDIKPYSVWNFDLPFAGTNDIHQLGGATYDKATGRIYISQMYGNGIQPVIHVFKVGTGSATTPTPTPTPTPQSTPAPTPAPATPAPQAPPSSLSIPPVQVVQCTQYFKSHLNRPRSKSVVVGPNDKWINTIQTAKAGTEVLLKDGTYDLGTTYTVYIPDEVTVRSQSGNRTNVIIKGRGYGSSAEGLTITGKNVVIADLTITGMRDHGITIKGEMGAVAPRIYNVHVYDIGTQHLKLTPTANGSGTKDGIIACSSFGYTTNGAKGSYLNAIDLHNAVNWNIRDNYIYNIYGDGSGCNVTSNCGTYTGGGGPAILIWNNSSGTVVEKNTIYDSFFGISFGHGSSHVGGVIRNNVIYRIRTGDAGIALQGAKNALVANNTVRITGYQGAIEARESSGIRVHNNFLSSPVWNRDGKSISANSNNIENARDNDFVGPNNIHLINGSRALKAGIPLAEVYDDIDGDKRSSNNDIGADQSSSGTGTAPAPTPTTPTPQLTPTPTPPTNNGQCTGLTGTYFNRLNFVESILARIDQLIHFHWGNGSPDSSIQSDTFSVRWTGYVVPQYSETYTFYTNTDDGVRLWVNGKRIINQWKNQRPTQHTGKITLTAGKPYMIRMDYYENMHNATAELLWSSKSQSKQAIPGNALRPTEACTK